MVSAKKAPLSEVMVWQPLDNVGSMGSLAFEPWRRGDIRTLI
jgi:hypothetical protein